ncbi:hypothetical protein LJK88_35005 [Paenibacillus sp. P26]|nr:hypothetical protein LJK88_35005 [Paenibacillus sp. P26]
MEFDYSRSLTHLLSHVYRLYRHNVDLLIQEYGVFPGQPPFSCGLPNRTGKFRRSLPARCM